MRRNALKFYAATREHGSDMTFIRMDLNEHPYGMLWTFTGKDEVHPWHLKTLSGYYRNFPTEAEARAHALHLANADEA